MILSLGLGEVAFIPDAHLGLASDDIDLTLVPLFQLYAGEDTPWEVLDAICTSEGWCTLSQLRSCDPLQIAGLSKRLGRVVALGLVQEEIGVLGPRYRLAAGALLRRLAAYLRTSPLH